MRTQREGAVRELGALRGHEICRGPILRVLGLSAGISCLRGGAQPQWEPEQAVCRERQSRVQGGEEEPCAGMRGAGESGFTVCAVGCS